MMQPFLLPRRGFLRSAALVAGTSFLEQLRPLTAANSGSLSAPTPTKSAAKVALARCQTYGSEVRSALQKSFDLLGGIGSLVRNKTVTVKINLTGTNFTNYLGKPVGETYMTHHATAGALATLLFDAGARRVRFVESTNSGAGLETTLDLAGWDVKALQSLGKVEFENTRNLGSATSYAHLKVPNGGRMFSSFDLNHSYADTDVMVSLAKLKNHVTAGVTLTMKNLFGITPNSLYGDEAGSEEATEGRGVLHSTAGRGKVRLPGLREVVSISDDPMTRVPRIIADLCAARPIDLAIIDGITSMTAAEGPWCEGAVKPRFVQPGVLIVGLNAVSTDAVGTAVMGYADPRAPRGQTPFHLCENHLALAAESGLGTASLAGIDVLGLGIGEARFPYEASKGSGG
jgi:uncharacterized protein (DUF362 family)